MSGWFFFFFLLISGLPRLQRNKIRSWADYRFPGFQKKYLFHLFKKYSISL